MGGEAGVGDNFESGEVAQFPVAVFADAGDDGFDMGFGDMAPLDVGEGSADPFVILFGEAGESFKEIAHGSEFADGGVGFAFGVMDMGLVHHDKGFDHGAESERDVFASFVGGIVDGFFYEEEEFFIASVDDFVAVMKPGEEGVPHEEEAGFEFVSVT